MADPKIRYDILANAEGAAEVGALATQLDRLDNAFDPSVVQRAENLATELRSLGAQKNSIDLFTQLDKAVTDAGFAIARADDDLATFAAKLASTTNPTKAQAGELQKLTDAAAKARAEFNQQSTSLDSARAGLDKLGISTKNLDQKERDVKTALAAARVEVTALGAESQRTAAAGDRLAAAWQSLGVRSFKDVQVEAAKVRTALQQIQNTSRNPAEIKIATDAAQAKLKALNAELGGVQQAAQESSAGISAGFAGALTQIAAAIGGVETLKKILEVGLERQKLSAQLSSIFEDSGKVASALGFIGETAQELGLQLDTAGTGFAKLAASSRGTNLEGEKTREIFTGIAQAGAALKLSNEEVSSALLAVSQIMTKGTVQSEELRGQLGERLPGAFQIAARAMGVTTAELGKLLETGKVASEDFLPKFAAELTKTFGPGAQQAAKGLDAEFNRLVNTLSTFANEIANSGLFDAVTVQVKNLAQALRDGLDSGELQKQAAQIGQALGSIVTFLGSAAEWALKFGDALLFVAKVLAEGALIGGIGKLATALTGIRLASTGAAVGMTALGTASAASTAGMAAAGATATASAAKVGLLGSALRLLPAGIAIAIAVEGIPAAGRAIGEFVAQVNGADAALAAAHQRRVIELDGQVAALAEAQAAQSKYVSLTLLGREQLLQQNDQTRAAYVAEVEGALAAAGAAQQYAMRLKERAEQEKERARLMGASTAALAVYGRQEREYAADAQKAADRQAELRKELQAVGAAGRDLASGLAPAAILLKEKLDAIVKSGKETSEVIKEIGKSGDLASVQGIQAFGQALQKLGEEGKLTPQQIREAWRDSIDKLTGEDLLKFTTMSKAAFGEVGRDALAAADVIDSSVRRAFKDAGLDFEEFRGGVSTATRSIVADLDIISAGAGKAGLNVERTALALQQAFEKGISGAKTVADLDQLNERVTALGLAGQVSAAQTTELKDAIDAARAGMTPLGLAAKKAGIDIGELTTGVSTGFKKGIADVRSLSAELDKTGVAAERASPLLAEALDKRLAAANTKEEIELLRAETEKLGQSGKLLGTDYSGALDKIRSKAEQLSPALKAAVADAKLLGVELRDNLSQNASRGAEGAIAAFERLKAGGKASAFEIDAAFVNMAKIVIAANQGIVPEWLKVEAAQRNARIGVDEYGRAVIKTMADSRVAVDDLARSFSELFEAQTAARNAAVKSNIGAVDKDGFALNTAGETISIAGKTITLAEGQTFDKAAFDRDAAKSNVVLDPQRYVRDPPAVDNASAIVAAELARLAEIKALGATSASGVSGFGPAPAPAPKAPAPVINNIKVGGDSFRVSTTDQTSAELLLAALEASYRSGGGS